MNKTVLVLINGHAGVGKDTFARFCQEYAEAEKSCKVYNIHRSDAPKVALHDLGWNGEKDTETRDLLKHMVDFMESKGLLARYLRIHIKTAKEMALNNDIIIFYHVRDPEVMYALMDEYIDTDGVEPISLLVKRDIDKPEEPDEWWGNLENAEYQMTLELSNSLESSKAAAKGFVDFLLDEEWEVVKQEEEHEL